MLPEICWEPSPTTSLRAPGSVIVAAGHDALGSTVDAEAEGLIGLPIGHRFCRISARAAIRQFSRDTVNSTDAASTLLDVGGLAFVMRIRMLIAGHSANNLSTMRRASVSRRR